MMARWLVLSSVALSMITFLSCGKPMSPEEAADFAPSISVKGRASFGVHCPKGIIQDPVPTKVLLMSCPAKLDEAELTQPLRPVILQADCKEKLIAVRTGDRVTEAPFWETMPDHSFELTFDGGPVYLKDDGTGRGECVIPSSLGISGRFECIDRDTADIYIQAGWYLGKAGPYAPQPQPRPTPSTTPSSQPQPQPRPTFSPVPAPTPSGSGRSIWDRIRDWVNGDSAALTGHAVPAATYATTATRRCELPPSCYLKAVTMIKQCH